MNVRRRWENNLFGDAYDGHDVERPLYGNTNILSAVSGDKKARQYGKSFFVLKNNVRTRVTIIDSDSDTMTKNVGMLDNCFHVLLGAHKRISTTAKRASFVDQLKYIIDVFGCKKKSDIKLDQCFSRYIEIQIHGTLEIERDVKTLVVDNAGKFDETLQRFKKTYPSVEVICYDGERKWVL